jgi:predicted oxidoreductase
MSFQYFVNTASNISIDNRPTVAQTISRSGMVRSVSRGNSVWRFTVTPATGPQYADLKGYILDAKTTGKDTTFNLQFNHSGHEFLYDYQGDDTGATTRDVVVNPSTYGYNIIIRHIQIQKR